MDHLLPLRLNGLGTGSATRNRRRFPPDKVPAFDIRKRGKHDFVLYRVGRGIRICRTFEFSVGDIVGNCRIPCLECAVSCHGSRHIPTPTDEFVPGVRNHGRHFSLAAIGNGLRRIAGERTVRPSLEQHGERIDGELGAYAARPIHRDDKPGAVGRNASFRIARPCNEVVVVGGYRGNQERLPVRFPSGFWRVDCAVQRLNRPKPIVGRQDIPCKVDVVRDDNREFVCDDRRGESSTDINNLSLAKLIHKRFRCTERDFTTPHHL